MVGKVNPIRNVWIIEGTAWGDCGKGRAAFFECEDADIVVVSYGAPVRSVITAVKKAQEEGKKVGYIKIDTPWPFPDEQIAELVGDASDVIVVEMNLGQMYYEVDRVLDSKVNTHLIGIIGGLLPTPDEILSKIEEIGGN